MNDFILMEVDERIDDLLQIIRDFHLNESFSSLYEFIQSLVGANLQQNIHILVVLEHMFKFHNVVMR